MRDQTCAALWAAVADALRSPGWLVNRRQLLRIGLIAAITLTLMYVLLTAQSGRSSGRGAAGIPGSILVADRYIPAFAAIPMQAVRSASFPPEFVPPGALRSPGEIFDTQGQALYVSAVPLPQGQPLTRNLLIDARQQHGLASLLRSGKVAVSFAADRVRGVGHWIQPGDTIALFHSPDPLALGGKVPAVRLVFPALTVLAVDRARLGKDRSDTELSQDATDMLAAAEVGGTVITVMMNLAQAPLLIEAQERGRLTAVLRAMGDELITEMSYAR